MTGLAGLLMDMPPALSLAISLACLLGAGAVVIIAVVGLAKKLPPTAADQAEDELAVDSMRARLQRDKAEPLDDIVDQRGIWWGPRL